MENSGKWKSMRQRFLVILGIAIMASGCFTAAAHAEWHFGIGTGLAFNNIDGDIGWDIFGLGAQKVSFKLDPSDFNDYTDTAIGFGGYATDGTWMVQYSYGKVKLKDSPTIGATKIDLQFEMTGAELTVGYPVYKTPSLTLLVDGGLRYTKHEWDNDIINSGVLVASQKFDNDWTDVLLGASLNVPFAETWSWNSRVNGGWGGSDGTYLVSTGVSWRFHKHWSTSLTGQYMSVDYENGSPGDSDWYYYNADESKVSLVILFNW